MDDRTTLKQVRDARVILQHAVVDRGGYAADPTATQLDRIVEKLEKMEDRLKARIQKGGK